MAAKQQTRRSISLMGTTYARLVMLGNKHSRPLSSIVEELVNAACDAHGIPGVARGDLPKREPKPRPEVHGGGVREF